ncbi:MAG: redox-sensing transcriptional repressor Rex [Clostridia bacterium]|nr:redox-sensing transcriptional repressor Rex [Clostridia bacterium]
MKKTTLSKATLGRLPMYLRYIRSQSDERISASEMARVLKLGEVLVRKDMNCISDQGRPKIGYPRQELLANLEEILGSRDCVPVVVVGAGKLGLALMRYKGFQDFGLRIIAGFDSDVQKVDASHEECPVLPVGRLERFCRENGVRVGVIAVPEAAAQSACDALIASGVTSIWNFAPCQLTTPDGVAVQNENLALSLAHLCLGERGGRGARDENVS